MEVNILIFICIKLTKVSFLFFGTNVLTSANLSNIINLALEIDKC